jgi:hypothetical protein
MPQPLSRRWFVMVMMTRIVSLFEKAWKNPALHAARMLA